MDSLMTLISVLVPMFAGFFIRVPKPYLSVLDRMLSVLVYAVLLLIGVSLARVENLGTQLDDIALTTLWLFFCTVGANLIVLAVLGELFPWRPNGKDTTLIYNRIFTIHLQLIEFQYLKIH